MQLRFYQEAAVEAVYSHLRTRTDNPVVVLPTGSGKTPVIATICRDAVAWGGRVLVIAHVKELLVQSVDKLRAICPDIKVGVYSAGLKKRDTDNQVIVAGIQSIYQRACELDAFDLILIDEAHMIPGSGEGMYRQFLADAKVVNPNVRVVGLTATDYRLDNGPICSPDNFLNDVCYEIGVKELIVAGYLSPLISKRGCDESVTESEGLRVGSNGEFIAAEAESKMDADAIVKSACAEIVAYAHDRKAVLIFAMGVKHGQHIVQELADAHGIECGFVAGDTPDGERDELLARFKGEAKSDLFGNALRPLKYLCNVNVLTTGFDAPHIDLVALLRMTNSPGLYYQMVGRGFRLADGKKNCLVLDFGGNIKRHGPIDDIRKPGSKSNRPTGEAPAKECPKCRSVVATAYSICPDCGYEFPPPERQRHTAEADDASILKEPETVATADFEVRRVYYSIHEKQKGDILSRTLRVEYDVGLRLVSDFVCIEHEGYARRKAEAWWKIRSEYDYPACIEDALYIANNGGVAAASAITVSKSSSDKYERITSYTLDEIPPLGIVEETANAFEEIPF